jgi:4-hydroxy-3-polyprenylbenzoate decarboxylase
MSNVSDPIIVAITGASGSLLAHKAIEALSQLGHPVYAVCSRAGEVVWQEELDEPFASSREIFQKGYGVQFFEVDALDVSLASGTHPVAGMLIIPCSMGTLAALAAGLSQNLIQRAADVTMKEGRPLVLVTRESPLSVIHLENMLKLARLGVKIVPPMPAFYAKPKTVENIADQIVARALTALGIKGALLEDQKYKG